MTVSGIKELESKLGKDSNLFELSIITVPQKGHYVKMKSKQFLPTPEFNKTFSFVKNLGGEYVSLGKNSHFRVPISQEQVTSLQNVSPLVTEIRRTADALGGIASVLRNVAEKLEKGE